MDLLNVAPPSQLSVGGDRWAQLTTPLGRERIRSILSWGGLWGALLTSPLYFQLVPRDDL